MNQNRWLLTGVVLAWLSCTAAHAQIPNKSEYAPPTPIPANGDSGRPQGQFVAPSGGLSDWILYRRPCCEGPCVAYQPLYTEIYLRAGPSFPIGGQTLSRELKPGWSIAGGARALFFNSGLTDAWVIDGHIINTNEGGNALHTPFPLTIFNGNIRQDFGVGGTPGVTVKESNRTMVGLGLGKEWYLWQPADAAGANYRIGFDAGGRYGSHRLSFNETRHTTDVIGGTYAAIHSDFECPTHCGMLITGVRLEWAYTWSDILQRNSDVQDISLFLNVGLRF